MAHAAALGTPGGHGDASGGYGDASGDHGDPRGDHGVVPRDHGVHEVQTLTCNVYNMTRCPDRLDQCVGLKKLVFEDCNVLEQLPDQACTTLTELCVRDAKALTCLPEWLGTVPSLTALRLHMVPGMLRIPSSLLGNLRRVTFVPISACSDDWLSRLDNVHTLHINNVHHVHFTAPTLCKRLTLQCSDAVTSIQRHCIFPPQCQLQHLNIFCLSSVASISTAMMSCRHLTSLSLSHCGGPDLPDELVELPVLRELFLAHCSITRVPERIGDLGSLGRLRITCCPITSLPESMGALVALRVLSLEMCNNLHTVPTSMAQLPRLKDVTLGDLPALQTFPDLSQSLCTLHIREHTALHDAAWLRKPFLTHLELLECPLPLWLSAQTTLQCLELHGNDGCNLRIIQHFPHLQTLHISDQHHVYALPAELAMLPALTTLYVMDMPNLRDMTAIAHLHALKSLRLSFSRSCSAVLPDAIGLLPALQSLELFGFGLAVLPVMPNIAQLSELTVSCRVPRLPAVVARVPKLRIYCVAGQHACRNIDLVCMTYRMYQVMLIMVLARRRTGQGLPAELMAVLADSLIPDGMVAMPCGCE